ncbi:type I restriction enzyme, S subunit [Roseovarius marisflavi]|uniref:Type I restriction enzyme, S subunit n=1 Tax=Roseovarius marisflavi TaxID=1054996 RepID=A0A1M6Y914_9RHOB|nr:restriction endonuclease subunit S [Roseovarius marisflavi]SHL14764.1 type I restriction enzyme, S subunit [Roseovarius marisflavi]
MKTGWEAPKLGDVALLRPNKKEVKSVLADEDDVSFVPMDCLKVDQVTLSEQEARPLGKVYSGYTYFCDGDVLLAKITPCFENGKLGIANGLTNGVGFGSSEFFVLRPNDKLLAGYLYHFLNRQSFRDWAKGQMTGAVGHKRVPKELVESLEIPLPPPEEQKLIVAVLDEAFEGLARARANAEANLQNARELFESYLATAFSGDEAGWDECELNDHVRFIDYRGKTPPKTEVGIRLITAKNVKMGYIQREPEEFILESAYEGWMTRGFPKLGDVLFSTEAPLANVAQLDTEETVVIGQRLITMQADEDVILAEFLKFSLMAPPMQSEIHRRGTGATVVGIKAKLLKTVPLRFPKNLDRQRAIAANCQSAYDDMERLEEAFRDKLQDIDDLRQSLLQKAFAGELT